MHHTNGVVAARKVVCGIFLPRDELFGMEQLAVRSRANFVYDRRLEVHEDATGDMFPGSRLGEESIECIVLDAEGLV